MKMQIAVMGNQLRNRYEQAFGKYVGASGACAFGLGRHALTILLKAIGVNHGDMIGVCGFTCLSVIEAIKVCGAKPVYLDVDENLCIDPNEILRHKAGSIKAVILQHTFGIPGKIGELLSACEKIEAKVIEDCAHSLGCFWKGKHLGSFGEGAIYSFEWGKPYSTGQGGMLTVNSNELLVTAGSIISELSLPSSAKWELLLELERRIYPVLENAKLKYMVQYGINKIRDPNFDWQFRLHRGYVRLAGKMTAKEGLKQLQNWPALMQLRRKNTEMIERYLSKASLPLWPRSAEADITMLRYPVITRHKSDVISQAKAQKLDIASWYTSPVHPLKGQELLKIDYKSGMCRRAEELIVKLVYLPTGKTLNEQKLKAMIDVLCRN